MNMLTRISAYAVSMLLIATAIDKLLHWFQFVRVLQEYSVVPASISGAVGGVVVAVEFLIAASLLISGTRRTGFLLAGGSLQCSAALSCTCCCGARAHHADVFLLLAMPGQHSRMSSEMCAAPRSVCCCGDRAHTHRPVRRTAPPERRRRHHPTTITGENTMNRKTPVVVVLLLIMTLALTGAMMPEQTRPKTKHFPAADTSFVSEGLGRVFHPEHRC